MANPAWISSSTNDHNTGTNWDTGTSPATGDTVSFPGPPGTANCTTNMTQAGETYAKVHISSLFTGDLGTSGSPYTPDAITVLFDQGAGNRFIGGSVASIYVDSPNANPSGLTLTCTGMALVDIVRGGVTVSGSGTTAASGRINLGGTGHLTLNGAAMAASTEIFVNDASRLDILVNIINLKMNGGEVFMGNPDNLTAATSTAILVDAGTLHFYGTGTQTLIEGRASGRIIKENNQKQTWSTVRLFDGNVLLDISRASVQNLTLSAGVKVLGANSQPRILWPSGVQLAMT